MSKKRNVRFSVGDDVQVVWRSPEDRTWHPSMDKTIGEFGKVVTVYDDYVFVEVSEKDPAGNLIKWWYLCDDLTNIKSDELDNVYVDDVMGFFE